MTEAPRKGDGALGNMDPNSQHQLWSKWTFRIVPSGIKRPPFKDVRHAAATFARLTWGSAGALHVSETYEPGVGRVFTIKARIEGRPVHDPQYVTWVHAEWLRWTERGFGTDSTCELMEAKLEAGDRQDGTPRDQLIIMDAAYLPRLYPDEKEH